MGDIWGLGGSSLISRLLGEKKDAEAAGAALATSLSNLLSCVIYLIIIITKCKVLTIDPKLARASICRIREVLRIGIPASVTNIMNSLSLMITNRFLVPYGNDAIAAMGIAMKINMLSMMTIIGFAFGGQPLYGYTYGSKNTERFKKTLRFAYLLEAGLGAVFAVILFFDRAAHHCFLYE